MGQATRVLAATLLVVTALCGAGAVALYDIYKRPGPLDAETVVVIPKGANVRQIASQLVDAGVVAWSPSFRLGVRKEGAGGLLRAGEYAIPAHASIRQVIDMLRSGRTVIRRLTVPEGLTSEQVAALVRAADGLTGAFETPPEGSLLPETYHFALGDDRAAVVQRMQDAMRTALAELWRKRAEDLPLRSPEEAVILASIVERETSLADERPRVAAVFINRLRRGMRLQADPTVVYAINGGAGPLSRPLTQGDLQDPSPYNTYANDGLPPGPIGNPGRASLMSVLNPLTTDELYFVADGSGGHAFARTLEEHNRNVVQWRLLLKGGAER
jgi:UPF0755 protein